MERHKERYLLMFLLLWQSVRCAAQDIVCSGTQHDGLTTYQVPEVKAKSCHYMWNNSTGHVLARKEESMDLVENSNLTTLTIRGCLEAISYKRDCISEGEERRANCNITCTGSTKETVGPPDGTGSSSVVLPVVLGILGLLVLVGLGLAIFLYYRRKGQTSRCCYTAVKTADIV